MNRHSSCVGHDSQVACRCRAECLCKVPRPANHYYDHRPEHHLSGRDYWTANCQPWVPSCFNGASDVSYDQYHYGSTHETNDKHAGKQSSSRVHDGFPMQARRTTQSKSTIPINPVMMPSYSIVGHPSLKIKKFSLPNEMLPLLSYIVEASQEHACTLPKGWATYLYSLTKQDIAIRDIPGLYEVARPIVSYIKRTIESVYNASTVRIDRNQPHVLKYSSEDGSGHTGVELHHDKCDLTANIMLSRSDSYSGGGTYFPDAGTVKLELGEFLIHPGNLVHAGLDITSGDRYLMVIFTHLNGPTLNHLQNVPKKRIDQTISH